MSSKEKIRETYMSLPIHQRDLLTLAMSHNVTEVVMITHNTFIGVNTDTIQNIKILEREGKWVLGQIL
jgi:hypothetical protein